MNELKSFHRFLGDQLADEGSSLTPEECLDLWRAQHPLDEELSASTRAIQEALDDMKAGDIGQPLEAFLAEFRSRQRLSS